MPKNGKKKPESIRVYLSREEKNSIIRSSGLRGQPISEYVRSMLLSTNPTDQNMPEDFSDVKRFQYIAVKLLLVLGSKALGSEDVIMEYFRQFQAEAETRYKECQ